MWWRRDEPAWLKPLYAPLLVAEGLFAAGAAARGKLYDLGALPAFRASVPVISVGNLTVGGSGKTPVVIALAERLAARGRKVAVLSRGYGATRTGARVVSDGHGPKLDAAEGGDEPVLIARRVPQALVLCGPRRAELAKQAAGLGAQVLLLDDGFQHRALARDLDVVLVDASNPFGNGHLLPRGPKREPLAALRRADLVWFTKIDQHEPGDRTLGKLADVARKATGRPVVQSRHAHADVLDGTLTQGFGAGALAGKRVFLMAGLARPDTFRQTADAANAQIVGERVFADHHRFTAAELGEAFGAAEKGRADFVVMTEKDAVRLPPERARDPRLRVVRLGVQIVSGEEALDAALDETLAGEGR